MERSFEEQPSEKPNILEEKAVHDAETLQMLIKKALSDTKEGKEEEHPSILSDEEREAVYTQGEEDEPYWRS